MQDSESKRVVVGEITLPAHVVRMIEERANIEGTPFAAAVAHMLIDHCDRIPVDDRSAWQSLRLDA